jgi:vancomycin permeability regulator SanA
VRPVIVIFGAAVRPDGRPSGAMRSRVEAALACGRDLEAAAFMPTGGKGRWGPAEAETMSQLLLAAGVPAERIWPVPTGANTIRSALACAMALRGEEGPVYVATSAYHLARCVLLLRIAGIPARPCRPAPVPASTRRLKRWYWRLREVAAVPVDSVLMLSFRLRRRL